MAPVMMSGSLFEMFEMVCWEMVCAHKVVGIISANMIYIRNARRNLLLIIVWLLGVI